VKTFFYFLFLFFFEEHTSYPQTFFLSKVLFGAKQSGTGCDQQFQGLFSINSIGRICYALGLQARSTFIRVSYLFSKFDREFNFFETYSWKFYILYLSFLYLIQWHLEHNKLGQFIRVSKNYFSISAKRSSFFLAADLLHISEAADLVVLYISELARLIDNAQAMTKKPGALLFNAGCNE